MKRLQKRPQTVKPAQKQEKKQRTIQIPVTYFFIPFGNKKKLFNVFVILKLQKCFCLFVACCVNLEVKRGQNNKMLRKRPFLNVSKICILNRDLSIEAHSNS